MYDAVVIGVSAGGMEALKIIFSGLSSFFPIPVIAVQHLNPASDSYLVNYLNSVSSLTVKEAENGENPVPGLIYISPPGYHLLIEPDLSFSLSIDPRVNFSCPSIDVLFESAADAFQEKLIGIVLTGANGDGSNGLKKIKEHGGIAIVQNPKTATCGIMPQAALDIITADYIVDLEQISPLLENIVKFSKEIKHV